MLPPRDVLGSNRSPSKGTADEKSRSWKKGEIQFRSPNARPLSGRRRSRDVLSRPGKRKPAWARVQDGMSLSGAVSPLRPGCRTASQAGRAGSIPTSNSEQGSSPAKGCRRQSPVLPSSPLDDQQAAWHGQVCNLILTCKGSTRRPSLHRAGGQPSQSLGLVN